MRIIFSSTPARRRPRLGDRRTTKKHGDQVRVLEVVQSGPYRGAWIVNRGRQCYEWVTPEEAYRRHPYLRSTAV